MAILSHNLSSYFYFDPQCYIPSGLAFEVHLKSIRCRSKCLMFLLSHKQRELYWKKYSFWWGLVTFTIETVMSCFNEYFSVRSKGCAHAVATLNRNRSLHLFFCLSFMSVHA
jgi:hypothetical protein